MCPLLGQPPHPRLKEAPSTQLPCHPWQGWLNSPGPGLLPLTVSGSPAPMPSLDPGAPSGRLEDALWAGAQETAYIPKAGSLLTLPPDQGSGLAPRGPEKGEGEGRAGSAGRKPRIQALKLLGPGQVSPPTSGSFPTATTARLSLRSPRPVLPTMGTGAPQLASKCAVPPRPKSLAQASGLLTPAWLPAHLSPGQSGDTHTGAESAQHRCRRDGYEPRPGHCGVWLWACGSTWQGCFSLRVLGCGDQLRAQRGHGRPGAMARWCPDRGPGGSLQSFVPRNWNRNSWAVPRPFWSLQVRLTPLPHLSQQRGLQRPQDRPGGRALGGRTCFPLRPMAVPGGGHVTGLAPHRLQRSSCTPVAALLAVKPA